MMNNTFLRINDRTAMCLHCRNGNPRCHPVLTDAGQEQIDLSGEMVESNSLSCLEDWIEVNPKNIRS